MQLHWALNMMDVLDHSGFHAKHAGVLVQFWMGNEGDEVWVYKIVTSGNSLQHEGMLSQTPPPECHI